MSTKKGKTNVSQADLRRMMQNLKKKKSVNETSHKNVQAISNASVQKVKSVQVNQTTSNNSKSKPGSNVVSGISGKSAVGKISISVMEQNSQAHDNQRQSKKHKYSEINDTTNGNSLQKSYPNKLKKLSVSSTNAASKSLISGVYSDSESSSDEEKVSHIHNVSHNSNFDDKAKKSETAKVSENILPAGFFDDPETDAKMRGVETPADKMDREWESFQKELQHETGQSEQLIDEEQESGHLDREIIQIDEQIQCYHRVDKLFDKIDHKLSNKKNSTVFSKSNSINDNNSSSSEDEDNLLDWREKDAFT